jgi:hypothetical protein
MGAAHDSNDAAFGALRTGRAAEPLNFCHNAVAVHGVFYSVWRNENITVKLRHGDIGDHETVAIVMQDETPRHFIAICQSAPRRLLLTWLNYLLAACLSIRLAPGPGQAIAAPGQFFDGTTFLKLREHFEQKPGIYFV